MATFQIALPIAETKGIAIYFVLPLRKGFSAVQALYHNPCVQFLLRCMMLPNVPRCCSQFQIVQPIVSSNFILVMYILTRQQLPTDMFFHHQIVF